MNNPFLFQFPVKLSPCATNIPIQDQIYELCNYSTARETAILDRSKRFNMGIIGE